MGVSFGDKKDTTPRARAWFPWSAARSDQYVDLTGYVHGCHHLAIQGIILSPAQALPIGNSNSSSDLGYISIE